MMSSGDAWGTATQYQKADAAELLLELTDRDLELLRLADDDELDDDDDELADDDELDETELDNGNAELEGCEAELDNDDAELDDELDADELDDDELDDDELELDDAELDEDEVSGQHTNPYTGRVSPPTVAVTPCGMPKTDQLSKYCPCWQPATPRTSRPLTSNACGTPMRTMPSSPQMAA